jgi:catechol 2,3-dioxygenase-like lactoylglutathione lyase family enzyme
MRWTMFEGCDTLAVYAGDMARAKAFYTGVLGFEVRTDLGPELCFLVSKSGRLHLYLEAGHRVGRPAEQDCRLSFFLRTEGSVFAVFDELKNAGVELLDDAPEEVGENTYTFRFRDPDGNILEAVGGA